MTWAGAFTGLGTALLVSVWVGGAIVAWIAITLRVLDRSACRWRYALALGALVAMALLPAAFWVLIESANAAWVGWCATAWGVGVGVAAIRIGNSALSVRRLRQAAVPAAESDQRRLDTVAASLNIRRRVMLAESGDLDVPCVIGIVFPVVVLPRGMAKRLTESEFDAIAAHELAHVVRRDYAWHLVQLGVAALLFHHPAAWWLSAVVDREREACCDQLAAGVADPVALASALMAVERTRWGSPHPARDTTPLLDRVSRLVQEVGLGAPRDASAVGTTALTLATAAAACGALAVLGAPLVVPVAEAASTAGSLAIGVGFVIGVRHAFEPDHLVAVATLVSRERGTAAAMRQGASWGLGHAVSLLALGSVLSVAQRSMPAALGAALEFGVGAMLVTMGVRALRDARSVGGTGPVQRHRHGLASHAHSTAGEHVHVAGFALARRPLAVGVVHGLAGSGAVTALVTSTLPTFPEQLLFVLFFGFGSTIGMAAMAGLAGWPLARFVRTAAAGAALSAATGAGAVVLGVLWVYPWARTLLTL